MEAVQQPQEALKLGSLASQNALVSRALFSRADQQPNGKRQKLEDVFEDPIMKRRFQAEYANVQTLPASLAAKLPSKQHGRKLASKKNVNGPARPAQKLLEAGPGSSASPKPTETSSPQNNNNTTTLTTRGSQMFQQPKPEWHPPWKLMRVISGHLGWVRSLAVEPGNKWFASGAGDRTIKIWDLATGSLRLTLTGHISTVRGLAVSPRHPYLFSCGEDKMVQVLGSRDQQSHPTLPWPSERRLYPVSPSDSRRPRHWWPRRCSPCLGHANPQQHPRALRPYPDRLRRQVPRSRPSGHHGFARFHRQDVGSRRRQDHGRAHPPQEGCSGSRHPPHRVYLCQRQHRQHQTVEVPRGGLYAEL